MCYLIGFFYVSNLKKRNVDFLIVIFYGLISYTTPFIVKLQTYERINRDYYNIMRYYIPTLFYI